MTDLPQYPKPDSDTGVGSDRISTARRSRWVYVVWGIGIALILLFVVLHLTGTFGPGGH